MTISKTLLLVCGSIAVADAFSPSFSQLPSRSVACSMAKGSPAIGRRDLLRGAALLPGLALAAPPTPVRAEEAATADEWQSTASGVKYKIITKTEAPGDKVGLVDKAEIGDVVLVQIKAVASDGQVLLDTSTDGKAFAIPLGKHKVIQGLEDGIEGMKSGERRKLLIPKGPLTAPVDKDLECDVIFERKSKLMNFFIK